MQYIQSHQGKLLLQLNSFLYRKEKIQKDVEYWRCIDKLCTGRLNLKHDEIIKGPSDHNHVADIIKNQAKVVVENIKKRAVETQDNPAVIISESSSSTVPIVFGALPQIAHLKRTIQRTRQRNCLAPPNPQILDDLHQLPIEYKLTTHGKQFVLYDSIDDYGLSNKRIIIFCTSDSLDLMSESDHWFSYGTFKSAPPIFNQIYTIHVLKHDRCIPTLYALLPDKKSSTYVSLLKKLKEKKIVLTQNLF